MFPSVFISPALMSRYDNLHVVALGASKPAFTYYIWRTNCTVHRGFPKHGWQTLCCVMTVAAALHHFAGMVALNVSMTVAQYGSCQEGS